MEETKLTVIEKAINKTESRMISMMGNETFLKEKSFLIQHFQKNKNLYNATYESVVYAVSNLANIGLTLNPALKLAYLVPRYENGSINVALEPSYQGLVKLITDSGSAKNVYCHLVYEGDIFEENLGTSVEIIHKPQRKTQNVILVYAVAVLHDGSKQVEVMTIEEINKIMQLSESYKAYINKKIFKCVWVDNFGEMARKTVIRRLVKYLPKTDMFSKLAEAIQLDENDYKATSTDISFIESLLKTSNINHDERANIEREMYDYDKKSANECITYLKNNQLDIINSGFNYSQTDIINKQKE